MSAPQKRKHIRIADFGQGLKLHRDTHGTQIPKNSRYVDLSDDEKPPQNGLTPHHKMLNGYSSKNKRLKYEKTLLYANTGEGSTPRPSKVVYSQLQEQREQLPIAKGRRLNLELLLVLTES